MGIWQDWLRKPMKRPIWTSAPLLFTWSWIWETLHHNACLLCYTDIHLKWTWTTRPSLWRTTAPRDLFHPSTLCLKCYSIHSTMQMCLNDNEWNCINIHSVFRILASAFSNDMLRFTVVYISSSGKYNTALTFWHQSFTFNSNKSPTWYNNFSVYYPDVCSSTCFGRFPAHHQELNDCSGSLWFYLRTVVIVVLCSWLCRPDRPRTQHNCYHDRKVKPEAATPVMELLMMGGKTPKTCSVVNKHQDNKLKNCCISSMIYLNFTMMHGLTNLKFYI
jgi:hypothetical protein